MKAFVIAAALVASINAPAYAAAFFQSDTEGVQTGFNPFDQRLGRLDSVVLDVFSNKFRTYQVAAPAGVTSANISYVTNGFLGLKINQQSSFFAATGSGGGIVSIPASGGSINYGSITTSLSGRTSVVLDNALALTQWKIYVDIVDPGFYGDRSGETIFTAPGNVAIKHLSGQCGNIYGFEDSCGFSSFNLTYNYTPTAQLGAVPEPATWALMILGFGAVGYAMRRRKVSVRFA